jgi:hypothetical protein
MSDKDVDERSCVSVGTSLPIEATTQPGSPDAGEPARTSPADQVEPTERNGSITGVGVVLGFSLAFTGQWSMQPSPWSWQGLVMLFVMLFGGALQLFALYRILRLPRHTVRQHGVAMRFFIIGVTLVFFSFALWVAFDVADLVFRGELRLWNRPANLAPLTQ